MAESKAAASARGRMKDASKLKHSENEAARRNRLRDRFLALSSLLDTELEEEGGSGSGASRVNVLQAAIDSIKDARAKIATLEAQLQQLQLASANSTNSASAVGGSPVCMPPMGSPEYIRLHQQAMQIAQSMYQMQQVSGAPPALMQNPQQQIAIQQILNNTMQMAPQLPPPQLLTPSLSLQAPAHQYPTQPQLQPPPPSLHHSSMVHPAPLQLHQNPLQQSLYAQQSSSSPHHQSPHSSQAYQPTNTQHRGHNHSDSGSEVYSRPGSSHGHAPPNAGTLQQQQQQHPPQSPSPHGRKRTFSTDGPLPLTVMPNGLVKPTVSRATSGSTQGERAEGLHIDASGIAAMALSRGSSHTDLPSMLTVSDIIVPPASDIKRRRTGEAASPLPYNPGASPQSGASASSSVSASPAHSAHPSPQMRARTASFNVRSPASANQPPPTPSQLPPILAAQACLLMSLDGQVLEASSPMLELLGCTRDQVVHQSLFTLLHPAESVSTLTAIQHLLRGGVPADEDVPGVEDAKKLFYRSGPGASKVTLRLVLFGVSEKANPARLRMLLGHAVPWDAPPSMPHGFHQGSAACLELISQQCSHLLTEAQQKYLVTVLYGVPRSRLAAGGSVRSGVTRSSVSASASQQQQAAQLQGAQAAAIRSSMSHTDLRSMAYSHHRSPSASHNPPHTHAADRERLYSPIHHQPVRLLAHAPSHSTSAGVVAAAAAATPATPTPATPRATASTQLVAPQPLFHSTPNTSDPEQYMSPVAFAPPTPSDQQAMMTFSPMARDGAHSIFLSARRDSISGLTPFSPFHRPHQDPQADGLKAEHIDADMVGALETDQQEDQQQQLQQQQDDADLNMGESEFPDD